MPILHAIFTRSHQKTDVKQMWAGGRNGKGVEMAQRSWRGGGARVGGGEASGRAGESRVLAKGCLCCCCACTRFLLLCDCTCVFVLGAGRREREGEAERDVGGGGEGAVSGQAKTTASRAQLGRVGHLLAYTEA